VGLARCPVSSFERADGHAGEFPSVRRLSPRLARDFQWWKSSSSWSSVAIRSCGGRSVRAALGDQFAIALYLAASSGVSRRSRVIRFMVVASSERQSRHRVDVSHRFYVCHISAGPCFVSPKTRPAGGSAMLPSSRSGILFDLFLLTPCSAQAARCRRGRHQGPR